MRIATWNVNSLNARLDRVDEWLAYAQPDVLLMQETKMSDDQWPALHFQGNGWESVHAGQGQWNGVAILSKVGIDDVIHGFGDGEPDDPEARILTATCGGVRVTSVYVPNGRSPDDDHYTYKLRWLARLRAHLEADPLADPEGRVLVGGDFNIAPDDRDVWNPQAFTDSTHVTPAEREALAHICEWGLADLFRARYDDDGLYSWWDYRGGAFHKKHGLRIDLLLTTRTLTEAASFVLMDRTARKGKQPSDHAPVMADFDL